MQVKTVSQQCWSLLSVLFFTVAVQARPGRLIRKRCHATGINIESFDGVKLEPVNISRVQLDHLSPEFHAGHFMSFEFKTLSESGVLFYARRRNAPNQYVAFYLDGGYLFYTVRCPKAYADLRIPLNRRWNDGQWHKVVFRRRVSHGFVEVDKKDFFKRYHISCDGFNSFVMGGIDPQDRHIAKKLSRGRPHYEGCIRDLRISTRVNKPPAYHAVSGCDD